jgi:hypothetical protein
LIPTVREYFHLTGGLSEYRPSAEPDIDSGLRIGDQALVTRTVGNHARKRASMASRTSRKACRRSASLQSTTAESGKLRWIRRARPENGTGFGSLVANGDDFIKRLNEEFAQLMFRTFGANGTQSGKEGKEAGGWR